MIRVRTLLLALAAALALGVALGAYAGGGEKLADIKPSPDGRERLEFYYPDRWRSFWNPHADYYVQARLVRVPSAEVLGTSAPFDMSGDGEVFWERDTVQIGTSAVFDRRTGKWTLLR